MTLDEAKKWKKIEEFPAYSISEEAYRNRGGIAWIHQDTNI